MEINRLFYDKQQMVLIQELYQKGLWYINVHLRKQNSWFIYLVSLLSVNAVNVTFTGMGCLLD